jgi:hypothetical protein
MSESPDSQKRKEDAPFISRMGPLEVDWPQSIGYFGGIALAVALELIEPPVAIFIAAIPFVKLFKQPGEVKPARFVSAVLEGAAKPVGGDSESTIRLAKPAAQSPPARRIEIARE